MRNIDSVQDILGHAENRVNPAHPLLAQQREAGYAEQSVKGIGEVARSVREAPGLCVLG